MFFCIVPFHSYCRCISVNYPGTASKNTKQLLVPEQNNLSYYIILCDTLSVHYSALHCIFQETNLGVLQSHTIPKPQQQPRHKNNFT